MTRQSLLGHQSFLIWPYLPAFRFPTVEEVLTWLVVTVVAGGFLVWVLWKLLDRFAGGWAKDRLNLIRAHRAFKPVRAVGWVGNGIVIVLGLAIISLML